MTVWAVCPLLFLTDLTRNPYQIQITLLAFAILALRIPVWIQSLWSQPVSSPFKVSRLTLAFLLFWAMVTWRASAGRYPVFQTPIGNEGLKSSVFLWINGYLAFCIGQAQGEKKATAARRYPSWTILLLALAWGSLWLPFHSARSAENAVWDPYGFSLWAILFMTVYITTDFSSLWDGVRLALFVSMVAGAYAMMQYFGRDVIWTGLLNPYGGRPVSTFGNPNFLSSYLVMTLPLAAGLSLAVPNRRDSWGYALIALFIGASLLCTLTRTSWAGVIVGLFVFGTLCRQFFNREKLKVILAAGLIGLGLIVLWPKSPMSGQNWSPLSRTHEFFRMLESGETYQPLHQRLLIWRSAWTMVGENPQMGKGWGAFELFYPFYQGAWLPTPRFQSLRTHANNAHNLIFEFWTQLGTLGLSLFLWLMMTIFNSVIRSRRRRSESEQILAAAALGGCAGMLADNALGNVSLFFAVPAFLFWWLAGMVTGLAEPSLPCPISSSFTKRMLSLGALLTGLFCLYHLGSRYIADHLYYEGFKLSKSNQPAQAIPLLEASRSSYPLEVNNAYELGNCYAREAKMLDSSSQPKMAEDFKRKAISAYRLALSANPGYDEIHYNLATMLIPENRLEEAFDHIEISLWINPLSHESYRVLSTLGLSFAARRERVVEFLKNGVFFFPNDFDLQNNLGYFEFATGHPDQAFSAFLRCVQINPRSPVAWTNLSNTARPAGQPTHPYLQVYPLFQRLDEQVKRKNYAQAWASCRTLEGILPENPEVLATRAALSHLSR